MDVLSASATRIRDAVASREVSAERVTRDALDAIERLDGPVHAFLEVHAEEALRGAREVDRRLAESGPGAFGSHGGLPGVPVALKDNICLAWGRTTCASRMLEHYRSPFTATAAQRLIDAGAVIVGKTNLDEFAMGSSCEHSAFGPTRNPWDLSRVPGGSSGGSAAAVAAGMVPLALGSDTGGSIRQPAGFCGVVGLKPSYGRVSRCGLVAYASSLDQIGPLSRTVADAALAASVICGFDPADSTSAALSPPDLLTELERPVPNLVIGVPRQARSPANHPAVARVLDEAVAVFRDLGALVLDVELPTTDHGIAAYYVIAPAEASSNLARFDGIRYGRRAPPRPGEGLEDLYARSRAEGFGAEVQRRIMLGTHALSSGYYDDYYAAALKVRRLIKRDFDDVFDGRGRSAGLGACHAVLMPSSPGPAFRLGEKAGEGQDPMAMYLEDVYTVGVNLAGLPAITLPGGFAGGDGAGRPGEAGGRLPVGVQLVGRALGEATLLRIARMFEAATGHGAQRPA